MNEVNVKQAHAARVVRDYQTLAQKCYLYARERAAEFFGGGPWGLATAFRNSDPADFTGLEVTPEGIRTTSGIWTSTTGGSIEHVEWLTPWSEL